jgi:predicted RNA binding protein YcfA (HicA-like mRNA interferase family)
MPSAKARDFQKVATSLGFLLKRTSGSHQHWEHPDGRLLTIPVHGGKEIGPPLFSKFLASLGLLESNFKGFAEKRS